MNTDLFSRIERECFVDLEEEVSFPPVCISAGNYNFNGKLWPIPICTYGNFFFLQGPPKSKKTFLVSLLASAYLNETNKYSKDALNGFKSSEEVVIHFDTEQGKFHAQRCFRRVKQMSGENNDKYKTFFLRELSHSQRLSFIVKYITEYKGKIGLVIIDGIADLISDSNNIEESNDLIQIIMTLSTKAKCSICLVIHSNHDSEKPTGHLGSFMEKKAETQVLLKDEGGYTSVRCKRSRNRYFDQFYFRVDDSGLPYVFTN